MTIPAIIMLPTGNGEEKTVNKEQKPRLAKPDADLASTDTTRRRMIPPLSSEPDTTPLAQRPATD